MLLSAYSTIAFCGHVENQENRIIKAKHFKQTKAVFHEPRKPQNAWASNERFFSPPILPFELLL
jgi:hypothetical protein